jgi:XRE family aerobic/anaerobic benzoate catabolism transcriptional regulator
MSQVDPSQDESGAEDGSTPLLSQFGERLRALRLRKGFTRRALSKASNLSERYLLSLECGRGNPSLVVLSQLCGALDCPMAELIDDATQSSAEWQLIRGYLEGCSEGELKRARLAVISALERSGHGQVQWRRVALIGLRGAGKSTFGKMLAEDLGVPLVELSAQIEQVAGLSILEIHDLYGAGAYRRYERRALEDLLQIEPDFVLATPGGLVSEASTLTLLLTHCTTVWLRATPEDHMDRVVQQGDLRPMSGSGEAMDDLRTILAGRSPFYAKADHSLDTSAQSLDETFRLLRELVRRHLALPV